MLALMPLSVEAQTVSEFRGLSQIEKTRWIEGWLVGVSEVVQDMPKPFTEPPVSEWPSVTRRAMAWVCTLEWTFGQTVAVFEKYIEEHPERWHLPTGEEWVLAALSNCGANGNQGLN